jgi:hypothetical protein
MLSMSYINLLRCADSVAAYSFGIHNTTHHVPLVLRTTQSSFAIGVSPPFPTDPLTTQTAYEPLGATPWTNTLPFLMPINWTGLVVKSAPPVTFHLLKFPLRACKQTFFPQHPASLLQPPVLSVIGSSRT